MTRILLHGTFRRLPVLSLVFFATASLALGRHTDDLTPALEDPPPDTLIGYTELRTKLPEDGTPTSARCEPWS